MSKILIKKTFCLRKTEDSFAFFLSNRNTFSSADKEESHSKNSSSNADEKEIYSKSSSFSANEEEYYSSDNVFFNTSSNAYSSSKNKDLHSSDKEDLRIDVNSS